MEVASQQRCLYCIVPGTVMYRAHGAARPPRPIFIHMYNLYVIYTNTSFPRRQNSNTINFVGMKNLNFLLGGINAEIIIAKSPEETSQIIATRSFLTFCDLRNKNYVLIEATFFGILRREYFIPRR